MNRCDRPLTRRKLRYLEALSGALLSALVLALVLGPLAAGSVVAAPLDSPSQVIPPTVRRPPPIIYKFFDWGTDYRTLHPEYGPIGSMHMINWYQINPAKGVFNWTTPDALIRREAGLTVTLRDGRVIPKPVIIQVAFYLAKNEYMPCASTNYWDGTPQWVYDQIDAENPGSPRPVFCGRKVGHVVSGCGASTLLPMFDNATWRNAYLAMVRALGEHYRNNPQIVGVMITTGLDGETQLVKDNGCNWTALVDQQLPGLKASFQDFVTSSMYAYREAFSNTAVWIQNTPGGSEMRRLTSNLATTIDPPIGIKNCGLWTDVQNHEGWGSQVGSWDMYRVYSQTLPIWVESAYGFGPPENYYWGWLAGLHYHPDGADVHESWITQSDPAWLRFVQDHLGRTLADTPDVWCALRDSEYPVLSWGASGQSGHRGDWTFWLTRLENQPGNRTVRLWKKDLPAACQDQVYSRQARRTDQATGNPYMSFGIDDGYPYVGQKPVSEVGGSAAYRVELTILNRGTDTFSLEYRNWAGSLVRRTVRKGVALGPADRWVRVNLDLKDAYLNNNMPGSADFRISCDGDGDETIHLVQVTGYWAATPPALTPTPAPATSTPSAGVTPTPSSPMPAPMPELTPTPLSDTSKVLVLRQEAASPRVVADTYIDKWAPTTNRGLTGWVIVRTADIKSALLRFPTPQLPPGARLERAVLRLYSVLRSNTQKLQVQAAQVYRPWSELDSTWTLAKAGDPWGVPGAGSTASDRAAAGLAAPWISSLNTWTDIDVTPAVRAWLENPTANAGLILRGISDISVEYWFASSQATDVVQRPQLRVIYNLGSAAMPTPAPAVTATPTSTPTTPPAVEAPTEAPATGPTPVQRILQQGLNGYAGQQDATLNAWTPTDSTTGAALHVRHGGLQVALLRFDLSAVPVGAALRSARLRLYVLGRTNANSLEAQGYALNRAWVPAQANWLQAAAGSPWAKAGGNGIPADRLGTTALALPLQATGTWVEADVTGLVKGWLQNPDANYGLSLQGNGSGPVEYSLASSAHPNAQLRPQLELTWDQN